MFSYHQAASLWSQEDLLGGEVVVQFALGHLGHHAEVVGNPAVVVARVRESEGVEVEDVVLSGREWGPDEVLGGVGGVVIGSVEPFVPREW